MEGGERSIFGIPYRTLSLSYRFLVLETRLGKSLELWDTKLITEETYFKF